MKHLLFLHKPLPQSITEVDRNGPKWTEWTVEDQMDLMVQINQIELRQKWTEWTKVDQMD